MIQRGEIWWAALGRPRGAEPGYRRPVLVVQIDEFNRSRIETVVVVAITTNTRLAEAPGNVLLPKKSCRLPETSVANVSQVATVNRSTLTKRISMVPPALLEQVDAGLRLILGL